MNITIRKERGSDIRGIHELTTAAFLGAPHAGHTEQFIVDGLRVSGALALSLVAESTGQLLGHVALSPVDISDGADGWYGLGPISVAPEKQGKGIGSQLMHVALAELTTMGANGCVLLGDPGYYSRFGFEPVAGLVYPGPPAEYFQALLLQGVYPEGTVAYHEAFSTTGMPG